MTSNCKVDLDLVLFTGLDVIEYKFQSISCEMIFLAFLYDREEEEKYNIDRRKYHALLFRLFLKLISSGKLLPFRAKFGTSIQTQHRFLPPPSSDFRPPYVSLNSTPNIPYALLARHPFTLPPTFLLLVVLRFLPLHDEFLRPFLP